ncbi:thiol:disulfide interchange protein DsbA/DsbL [Nitrosomonas aestuarii]|uniref:thiol:disulfide interchange protein DsbA/DsbL n=1 Tax=Nitrosomonas aestuarii TaxID=52441 RepID=UPI000D3115D0|nr:thiol:disulfide interchange protein DsbA/DsbL [Nitrosomonas aestuarii]PTN11383.1 thiol:disulfide interchange protein DsbA [Nitrosomonas aestuarii]
MSKLIAIVIVVIGTGLFGMTSAHAEIVEGRDYKVLENQQPVRSDDRIEVIEFFWYGCQYCNSLHPHIKEWLKNKPSDVDFRYVPAIFRDNWIPGAKAFYTIETLDIMETIHDKIYDAIHQDKINLTDESVLFGWVEKQGVDKEKFVNIYNSFTIQNQVARSNQMTRQYQLTGVPALVIEGKYVTSGRQGGTPQLTIRILDEIIDMVRKSKE